MGVAVEFGCLQDLVVVIVYDRGFAIVQTSNAGAKIGFVTYGR